MIENEEKAIAEQQWSGSFAETEAHSHLHARVFLPDKFSVEVVGVDPARSERGS